MVRQFDRRPTWREAAFLHEEIGQRMLERLRYIRLEPQAVLDAGCGGGWARAGLAERYPHAHYQGHDVSAVALAHARAGLGRPSAPRWWPRWGAARGGPAAPEWHQADLAATGLPAESIDLIWSNLALHWHPAPPQVFTEWFRLLRPGGLVMFSTYGPATLHEVRQAVDDAGLATRLPSWIDMHDFGDMLLENGFVDPVMDQETLTLTYPDATSLLNDVRRLGGNPAHGRRAGLAGRSFRQRLVQALEARRNPDGRLGLTIEVAYGHAWRGTARRHGNETHIPVSAITRRTDKPV